MIKEHYKKVRGVIGVKQETIQSSFDYIQLAKRGIRANSIANFSRKFNLNKEATASLLDISEPTLYRWLKNNKNLDRNFAVKLLEITDVFIYGVEVFKNKENFIKWLRLPNTSLGGMEPLELLEYPTGISKVRDVLGRIEHGIFS